MQISTAQPTHRSVGGTFVQMSNGGLELKVDRHQFPADFSLTIPDGCVLYLSKIERWIPVSDTDQVMYSDLNNRPAELHGLESEEIFNLENVNFITKLLHQLEETHATFVWELGELFLSLFNSNVGGSTVYFPNKSALSDASRQSIEKSCVG